jgi:hypothetical protein
MMLVGLWSVSVHAVQLDLDERLGGSGKWIERWYSRHRRGGHGDVRAPRVV